MGFSAGRQLTTGDFNVLFGKNAGNKLNRSSRNVMIGNNAAPNMQSDTSNDNLILGNDAGFLVLLTHLKLITYRSKSRL